MDPGDNASVISHEISKSHVSKREPVDSPILAQGLQGFGYCRKFNIGRIGRDCPSLVDTLLIFR